MKKAVLFLLPLALAAAGCSKTELIPSGGGGSSSQDTRLSAELKWSADSYNTKLEDESPEFPTLTNPHDVKVAITSSNTAVATVASDGSVLRHGVGTTSITASFEGDENYLPATVSYVLSITSGTDEGAGNYTFPSSGDAASADDISNTTFTRKISVTYSSGGATVKGDYYGYVTVSGNNVTVNNTGEEEEDTLKAF